MDLDLHGIVGVRLADASPADAAVVRRQLGLPERPLGREPDVVVRFVDALPTPGLRYAEYGRTGFTDDGFFVLQSRKRAARVRVALDAVGGPCELVCQRGARAVPLLMAIVTMTALARGHVPLHASAFVHEGAGVLVTGWAKGGKTEALLAFAARGAAYVGDEWILLAPGGRAMYGIPEHIRLQDWHLRQLPAVRRRVRASRTLLFGAARALDRVHRAAPRAPLLGDVLPALRRQLNVQLDPRDVFPRRAADAPAPERVFLMLSHDAPDVTVAPADPLEVARRMTASNWYEQQPLLAAYQAYRFAFPDRRNALLERAPALQAELLAAALAGRPAFEVRHPYPCDLGRLFEAMAPACRGPHAAAGGTLGTAPAAAPAAARAARPAGGASAPPAVGAGA